MAAPVELLKNVPLFHGLSEKELKSLANNFTERTFTEPLRQGEMLMQ